MLLGLKQVFQDGENVQLLKCIKSLKIVLFFFNFFSLLMLNQSKHFLCQLRYDQNYFCLQCFLVWHHQKIARHHKVSERENEPNLVHFWIQLLRAWSSHFYLAFKQVYRNINNMGMFSHYTVQERDGFCDSQINMFWCKMCETVQDVPHLSTSDCWRQTLAPLWPCKDRDRNFWRNAFVI